MLHPQKGGPPDCRGVKGSAAITFSRVQCRNAASSRGILHLLDVRQDPTWMVILYVQKEPLMAARKYIATLPEKYLN